MAQFEFKCPQCGQSVEADESLRGQVAECPSCGKGIVIPRGKPALGANKRSGSAGNMSRTVPPMLKHSNFVSSPRSQAAIPERLARPTQDQVTPPRKLSAKNRSRKVLTILLIGMGITFVTGAISYGGYLYFGDVPRLERGIAHYEKKVYAKAYGLLLPLAKAGYAKAQLYIGDCYANGNGVIMDTDEATKWYRAAADQEIAEAQHRMFTCCSDGVGIERNLANAAKWCRKAAEAGLEEAMFDMGMLYVKGAGVEQNAKSAFKWFRKGAERGHPMCLYKFGQCYKLGYGIEKDEDEAQKWQSKAVSIWKTYANAGDALAMIHLANLYKEGDVVELDKEEAAKWYRKAAEAGNALAQSKLALCYRDGEGVEKDMEEAAKWLLKSAEQGIYRDSQWLMGMFYQHGKGVEKNITEAIKWFERSAKKGYPAAKYSLAMCYLRGEGVEHDEAKGEELLEDAAEAGDEDAKSELIRIKNAREAKARRLAQEKAQKESKIKTLSSLENEIEERKERVNNILKGKLKGDWSGFDATKITMTDTSVSVVEEPPLKRATENLYESDPIEKIDQLLTIAQKEAERLEERLKDIARVKSVYDAKELESRKEICTPCGGTGSVACSRCKGAGEVISMKKHPCPSCGGDSNDFSGNDFSDNDFSGGRAGKGQIKKEVTCGKCEGKGEIALKCSGCRGSGKVTISYGGATFDRRETCSSCGGSGKVPDTCPRCSGMGKVEKTENCPRCRGTGFISSGNKVTCPVCEGKCKLKCERCDGRGFTYRPKEGIQDNNQGSAVNNDKTSPQDKTIPQNRIIPQNKTPRQEKKPALKNTSGHGGRRDYEPTEEEKAAMERLRRANAGPATEDTNQKGYKGLGDTRGMREWRSRTKMPNRSR